MWTKDSELGVEVLEEVQEMEVRQEMELLETMQELGER